MLIPDVSTQRKLGLTCTPYGLPNQLINGRSADYNQPLQQYGMAGPGSATASGVPQQYRGAGPGSATVVVSSLNEYEVK